MSKPAGYRYGSWLILHGGGAHLVGFSTACWLSRDSHESLGLWSRCKDSHCHRLSSHEAPGWLEAARVLSCLSVLFLAFWLVVGCQCQCIKTRQQRYRWMVRLEELLAILAGCVALLPVGIFAVAVGRDSAYTEFSPSWSLWLVVGGASACTMGGFIVAGTRNPAHPAPKPSTRSVRPSNMPTLGAGGQGQDQTAGHDARTTRGEQRRSGDTTDIFNVISFNRCPQQGGADSNARRAEMAAVGRPPPPYSVHAPPTGQWRDWSGQGDTRDDLSTQVYEISLSPPPSYEYALNEQPPPYEPRPAYPCEQQQPGRQQ